MNFSTAFPGRYRVLLPVIHVQNLEQALRETGIALTCGADGVFLIDHTADDLWLYNIYVQVREQFPTVWIGLNFLGCPEPIDAIRYFPQTANGLWIDNLGNLPTTSRLWKARALNALLFGGVAFKTHKQISDLEASLCAHDAAPYLDVITTSGPRTGCAPSTTKMIAMRLATRNHALAIASGITPENVEGYLTTCNAFLVATGISRKDGGFDPTLVRALAERIHALLPLER